MSKGPSCGIEGRGAQGNLQAQKGCAQPSSPQPPCRAAPHPSPSFRNLGVITESMGAPPYYSALRINYETESPVEVIFGHKEPRCLFCAAAALTVREDWVSGVSLEESSGCPNRTSTCDIPGGQVQ